MTNAVSSLVIVIGPFVFVAGTLLYPATFLLTDMLSEVYGKRVAQRAVWTGFLAQLLALASVGVISYFPTLDPASAEAWHAVFSPMWRIAVASMLAYLVSQSIDVTIFHAMKDAMRGRHLWLRNNVSTMTSQAVDTCIFVLVAFAGVLDARTLVMMVLGQWAVKSVLALLDTPVVYACVAFARGQREGRP